MLYCDKYQKPLANSGYKILIVEDSEFVNNIIFNTLTKMGYQCEQAFAYAITLHNLANNKYDFIILDLNLPDAYGTELVKNVQRLSKAKIIIFTSETDIQLSDLSTLFQTNNLNYYPAISFCNIIAS
jgi:DNA-binding NtrC family response regulator